MIKHLETLKGLFGPESWARQVAAWRFGVLASVCETASLATIIPLISLVLSESGAIQLGPFAVSRAVVLAAIVLIYAAGLCLRTLAAHRTARVTLTEGYALSSRIFAQVLEQPQAWHSAHHSAEIRALLLSDAQDLISLVTIPIGRLLAQIALVCCVSIVLIAIRPLEAIVAALALGSVYSLVFVLLGRGLRQQTENQLHHHTRRQRYSTEALSAIREVRLSQLESVFAQSFSEASEGIAASGGKRTLFTELPKLMLEAILFLLLVVFLLVLSSAPEADPAQALPTLVLFGVVGLKLFPIGHLIYANLASLRSGQPLIEKLETFAQGLVRPTAEEGLPRMQRGFDLVDVSFTHSGSPRPVLKDLCLVARRGQSIAITGASGSGKSTLIDIIAGLVQPDKGTFLVDDIALALNQVRSWQRQLRYCPQSPSLFDTDIVGNITNDTHVDPDRLKHALYLACLDDFDFPLEGRSVGELGRRLSGGQVQRIGLARAFYHDAPVYILDEPTSHLDAQTAERFVDRLFSRQGEAILVIVTHDKRLAARCDSTLHLLSS